MRGFVVGWMDREKDGRGQRAEGRGQGKRGEDGEGERGF